MSTRIPLLLLLSSTCTLRRRLRLNLKTERLRRNCIEIVAIVRILNAQGEGGHDEEVEMHCHRKRTRRTCA